MEPVADINATAMWALTIHVFYFLKVTLNPSCIKPMGNLTMLRLYKIPHHDALMSVKCWFHSFNIDPHSSRVDERLENIKHFEIFSEMSVTLLWDSENHDL